MNVVWKLPIDFGPQEDTHTPSLTLTGTIEPLLGIADAEGFVFKGRWRWCMDKPSLVLHILKDPQPLNRSPKGSATLWRSSGSSTMLILEASIWLIRHNWLHVIRRHGWQFQKQDATPQEGHWWDCVWQGHIWTLLNVLVYRYQPVCVSEQQSSQKYHFSKRVDTNEELWVKVKRLIQLLRSTKMVLCLSNWLESACEHINLYIILKGFGILNSYDHPLFDITSKTKRQCWLHFPLLTSKLSYSQKNLCLKYDPLLNWTKQQINPRLSSTPSNSYKINKLKSYLLNTLVFMYGVKSRYLFPNVWLSKKKWILK